MKQENEFVLPKKWKIQVTKENRLVLGEYYNRNGKKYYEDYNVYGLKEHINQFYSSHNLGDENLCVMNEFQDYKSNFTFNESHRQFYDFKTITFRQFQEHVLKEIPKPEYDPKYVAFNQRKVIGYKLIKPEYKEAAELIAFNHIPNLTNRSFIYQNGACFTEDCKVKDNLEEAGVMHWFELVYDTSIKLKSGVKLSEDDIAEVKEILNTGNRNNNLI